MYIIDLILYILIAVIGVIIFSFSFGSFITSSPSDPHLNRKAFLTLLGIILTLSGLIGFILTIWT